MKSEHHNNAVINLNLTMEPDRASLFSHLLGQGFIVIARTGVSIRDLLCRQIGVSDDYLDQRIQTIFLDGKVIDDVETAVIGNGTVLALSAAMPGLAGATLRRGGAYAAMRKQISYSNDILNDSDSNGSVMIKLFNLVALELGPLFLEQGIRIDGKQMENFFRKASDFFWDGCSAATIDGIRQDVRKISLGQWRQHQVFLKLEFKE
ncbi:MAG: hypothetical protein P8012_00700 [Desulfobacterales bacterium]